MRKEWLQRLPQPSRSLSSPLDTPHHSLTSQLLEPVQTAFPIRAGVPVASETLARLKTTQHVTALARIERVATSVSRVSAARMGRLETGRLEVETLRASGFACWMGGWMVVELRDASGLVVCFLG